MTNLILKIMNCTNQTTFDLPDNSPEKPQILIGIAPGTEVDFDGKDIHIGNRKTYQVNDRAYLMTESGKTISTFVNKTPLFFEDPVSFNEQNSKTLELISRHFTNVVERLFGQPTHSFVNGILSILDFNYTKENLSINPNGQVDEYTFIWEGRRIPAFIVPDPQQNVVINDTNVFSYIARIGSDIYLIVKSSRTDVYILDKVDLLNLEILGTPKETNVPLKSVSVDSVIFTAGFRVYISINKEIYILSEGHGIIGYDEHLNKIKVDVYKSDIGDNITIPILEYAKRLNPQIQSIKGIEGYKMKPVRQGKLSYCGRLDKSACSMFGYVNTDEELYGPEGYVGCKVDYSYKLDMPPIPGVVYFDGENYCLVYEDYNRPSIKPLFYTSKQNPIELLANLD